MTEQQVRQLRIVRHPGQNRKSWAVEYGYWKLSERERRFVALREWTASDETAAKELKRKLDIELLLSPELLPPVDAEPLPAHYRTVRQLGGVPHHREIVKLALSRLPDPLLPVEALHASLGLKKPSRHEGGWQFYVYLTDPPYQRLLSLANAAGVTRNQMIEALLYSVEE